MDAAAALKRKGEEAPEAWLLGGVAVPATKIRRLDAEVPPVGSGAGVLPQPQHAIGVQPAAPVSGHVGTPAVDAAPLLKRKDQDAPQPWFDVDGVPVPATKIRRIDADVPPVESAVGVPGASVTPQQPFVVGNLPMMSSDVAPPAAAIGVAAPAAVNEERAIVVYQPAEAERTLLHGPLRPGVSLRVSPEWIHGLRSTMMQEASSYRALFGEMAAGDEDLSLAMVPWAPAKAHAQAAAAAAAEMMDADQDGDGASMEVEHGVDGQTAPPAGGAPQGEAFQHHYHHQQQQQQQHPWPAQQHCVASPELQLPAASYQPSPVTWSW